ncbi:MAG: hypothetical protein MRZ61_05485 [Oscillospiraceae bacterium]|nr:hypothetical protein [Oscillospiraceae bacterium]
MEKLNNTAKELNEIAKDLSDLIDTDMVEASLKVDQVRSIVTMADAFVNFHGNTYENIQLTNCFNAMLSVIELWDIKCDAIVDKLSKMSHRLDGIA